MESRSRGLEQKLPKSEPMLPTSWLLLDTPVHAGLRLKSTLVPSTAQLAQLCCQGFRQPISQSMVQDHAQGERAPASQRHVIPRYVYAFECISLFELAHAAPRLFPISKFRVNQVRNMSVSTRTNRLCHQRIRGRLIPVPDHGDDVHHSGLSPGVVNRKFNETDQFVVHIGSDKDARI